MILLCLFDGILEVKSIKSLGSTLEFREKIVLFKIKEFNLHNKFTFKYYFF